MPRKQRGVHTYARNKQKYNTQRPEFSAAFRLVHTQAQCFANHSGGLCLPGYFWCVSADRKHSYVTLRGLWGVIGKVPARSHHRPRLQGLRNTLYSSGAYYRLPGLLMFGGSFSGEYVLQAMIQPRTGFNRRGVFLEMK